MSAETTLTATLLAYAPLTALVGSGSSARIYPDNVPQEKALPCVAYSRTATEHTYTIHGSVIAEKASIEVWCMASRRADAEQMCDQVAAACKAAGYTLVGRRAELDTEAEVWGSVLNVEVWTL
jgi:hypothetical protein